MLHKLYLFILLLFTAGVCLAQLPDATTLMARLDGYEQKVLAKVDSTAKWKRPNAIYYGTCVLQAIDAARNLAPAKKIAPKQAETIANPNYSLLDTLVNRFISEKGYHTKSITATAQQFIATTAYKTAPVVNLFPGKIIKTGDKDKLELVLTGSFVQLNGDEDDAKLTGPACNMEATSVIDNQIVFTIDPAVLNLTDAFSYTKLTVSLTYHEKKGKFKKLGRTLVYSLLVGSIPSSPGVVEIISTKNGTNGTSQVEHKRTRTFLLNSSRQDLLEKQCIPSVENATVIPESIELVVESSTGKQKRDWNYRKTTTGGKTCFIVETFYNKTGESGKVEFHLKYDVKKSGVATEAVTDKSQELLVWGTAREIPLSGNKNEVTFINYNGERINITSGRNRGDVVQFELAEKNLVINVPGIEQLIDPAPDKP